MMMDMVILVENFDYNYGDMKMDTIRKILVLTPSYGKKQQKIKHSYLLLFVYFTILQHVWEQVNREVGWSMGRESTFCSK